MEHVSEIDKIAQLGIDPKADMAINCEWVRLSCHYRLSIQQINKFNLRVHSTLSSTSTCPERHTILLWIRRRTSPKSKPLRYGSFVYFLWSFRAHQTKKLISGRYLGEILRLVICELIDEGVLFLGQNTYKLDDPYCFDTAFLSLMESDPTDELLMIIGIFTHFFALETTLAERQFFRALARLIGRRAARLSACGIAAIVQKMGYLEEGCSVGADGSLYNVRPFFFKSDVMISLSALLEQKYPGFADRVHEGLIDIFGEKGRCVDHRTRNNEAT